MMRQMRSLSLIVVCCAAAAAALLPGRACAVDHAPAGHGAAEGAAGKAEKRIDILDLGLFRIRSSRTTDREISDLKFALHLVLSSKTTEAEYEELEHWQQRLRDQVVIAVRGVEPADFDDPELRRLHRLILFRVKRLPISEMVIGVYLTDFALDHGETIADAYAPPIIIKEAPKKKPAGGGH